MATTASTADVKIDVKEEKGNRGRKPFVQVKHKVNEYKPIIETVTDRSPKRYHTFTHDPRGITDFVQDMAYPLETATHAGFNSQPTRPVLDESLKRLGHFAVAKKMAYAMDETNRALYAEDLKPILKAELIIPDIIQRVIDGYGTFVVHGAHFRPDNLALHAYTHFVKGVHIAGQYGIPNNIVDTDMIINIRMADWNGMVVDYYRSKYNRWSETTDQRYQVNIGGQQHTVKPFSVYQGFTGLAANLVAGAVILPPDIFDSLAILEGFEQNAAVVGFPTQAHVNAFRVHGLIIIDWTFPVTKVHVAQYLNVWEQRISQQLTTVFRCMTGVRTMDNSGKPWQLMDSVGSELSEHPIELGDGDREIGYMLEQRVYHKFDAHQMWTKSDISPGEARIKFIRNSIKGQNTNAV